MRATLPWRRTPRRDCTNERPTIIGNADELREIVRAYRDAGVDELSVPDFTLGPRAQKLATLDRFMHEAAAKLG